LSYLFKLRTRPQNTSFASPGQYRLLEGKGFRFAICPEAGCSGVCPPLEPFPLKVGRLFTRDFKLDFHVDSSDGSIEVGVSSKVSNSVGRSNADKGRRVFVECFFD
jgi:hypothetical protein